MKTGYYISGIGHGGLILWVLVGGIFSAPPPEPLEVAQVSLVSAEEFAALNAPASAPRAVEEPVQPPAPEPVSPVPPPRPETPPERAQAPDVTQPVPETPPDVSNIETPPVTEVEDTAPTAPTPPIEASESPVIVEPAPPRPAPRVAPEAAPAPPLDATVDDTVAEATVPSPEAAIPAPEVEESTAPEEATTQIVTEADDSAPSSVLASSPRPKPRPSRPAPAPAPDPSPTQSDAIAAALAEAAQSQTSPTTSGNGTAPLGPPVTQGERDALRVAVSSCWVVDVGSEAGRITVTLAMSMNEDGTVKSNSLRMVSNTGGTERAVESAFQAARRAVLRCQKGGYPLPLEKYGHWKEIEMVFDTSNMRIK